jgi:SAM-dependent methyltransferase
MGEVMDWDAAYRNHVFAGPPPWNIGEAQPEMVNVIESGGVRSPVLDVGCGVGDVSFLLAARGYRVVGIDVSSVAIEAATEGARERGLAIDFIHGDVRELTLAEQFNTIVDCTLFHSLPVDAREGYLQGIRDAAADGATLFMLVFTTDALPPDSPFPIPNLFTDRELRDVVSKYWTVEDLRSASVYVQLPDVPGLPEHNLQMDDRGRAKLPAMLLTARKS